LKLADAGQIDQAREFLQAQGSDWGARRSVIDRANQALIEALEAVAESAKNTGPVSLRAQFDELNLKLRLDYTGRPLTTLGSGERDVAEIFEHGDMAALKAALEGLPTRMLARLTDRMSSGGKGQQAWLQVEFEH
jgi:hypothetical protein